MTRFWLACVLFHVLLALVACALARRWPGRLRKRSPWGLWAVQVLADFFLLGWGAFLLAVACASPAGHSFFTAARFLAQGLFVEGPIYCIVLAAIHWRAARAPSGVPTEGAPPIVSPEAAQATARRRRRRRGAALLVAAGLLLGVYWDAYHRCPYDLKVRRHAIDLSNGRPEPRTLRILHLSDFQAYRMGPYEERVMREAAAQQADLVLFTGDYVQSWMGSSQARAGEAFNSLLRRSGPRPPLGFLAVEGDCEDDDWPALFAGTGVRCLSGEGVRLPLPGGRTLEVMGLTLAQSRARRPEALRSLLVPQGEGGPVGARGFGSSSSSPSSSPSPSSSIGARGRFPDQGVQPRQVEGLRLVMGHSPDFVRALSPDSGVDLALAGHTHGGQVVVPGVGPLVTFSRLPNRYAGGLNDYRGIPLHVSRGTGLERFTAPPVRFFCPPEICMLEVRY